MAIGDEKVTIRIDVKANTAEIDRVRQKLRQLCREADDCADTFDRYSKSVDDSAESHKNLDRNSTDTTKRLRQMGREANALSKILKTAYKFAFIAAGIETAALALALSSVNGLLATGRFLVKSYHVAMSALAKAAATAGVALATVAAAQRQFVAAQATGRYGGNYALASRGLRTMTADANLASLGMKALTGAFVTASKNARVTGVTTSAMAGLMDFAVASGDIEKGAAAVANLVSLVQKGGAGQAGVLEAAKELGPEFEKAFKAATKGGKATSAELMKLFSSGELARQAGLAGGFAATQGSLVGQLKAFMTEMQVMFADLGMQFIEPVQQAFEEIRRIMVRTVTQLMPLLNEFAQGSLLDKLVNGIDKMSQFLVTLMRDYVPRTQGFFQTISSAWDKLTNGFERFNKYLRQFSAASKIINKFFGQIFGAIGSGLKNNFEAFGVMLVDNQVEFDKFGQSLARLITEIFNLFNAIREAFMKALPYISSLAEVIANVVRSIADLLRMMTSFGGFGALAGLMLPMMAGLGGKGKGGAGGRRGGKMGGAGVLGMVGATLGTAALTSIPGIGKELGSMASAAALAAMFAPTTAAGSFALPAALAAAGYVGTDTLTDMTYREGLFGTGLGAKNKAVSAGTGAAAGTAIGATVGSILPGVGTAIGAIGGAIIGGIIGGVNGWMKEGKYKKQAKDAARTFVDGYSSAVEEALGSNDYETAAKALAEFNIQAKLMADNQVKSGTALKEANALWEENRAVYESALDTMLARTNDLMTATGLSAEGARELATAAGVDLSNSMLTLKDILEQTGVATMRTAEQFKYDLTDAFGESVAGMRTALDTLNAPAVVDEATRSWMQKARAGTVGAPDTAEMLQTVFQQELLMSGNDPLLALQNIGQQIGYFDEAGKFVPGAQFAPGAQFEGLADTFLGAGGQQIYEAGLGGVKKSAAQLAAEQIVAGAAGQGKTLGISVESLASQLSTLSPQQLALVGQRATLPGAFQAQYEMTPYGAMPTGAPDLETQLTRLGLGEELMKSFQIQDDSFTKMKEAATDFRTTAGFMKTDQMIFSDAVDKFALAVGYAGDTSSPRRNMVGTLGTHSKFDMAIAGKRSITSGFRTWGLGSINSDHAAGRAYDLVGQNLGLYQASMRSAGGFAEFHGSGAARHLHVVPPTGPVGDTATPSFAQPMTTTGTTSNNMTVNMTVNGAPGMDVGALADEVMARIDAAKASWQERY